MHTHPTDVMSLTTTVCNYEVVCKVKLVCNLNILVNFLMILHVTYTTGLIFCEMIKARGNNPMLQPKLHIDQYVQDECFLLLTWVGLLSLILII